MTSEVSDKADNIKTIEIDKLGVQQLSQMKQQLEQEIEFFNESLQQLKSCQSKFNKSLDSVSCLDAGSDGKSVLVPLSASLYVPGQLVSPDRNLLISVGAGYFLQHTSLSAQDYFKRRIKHVTEQMEKIQSIGIQKQRIRDALHDTLDSKMKQQRQGSTAVKSP